MVDREKRLAQKRAYYYRNADHEKKRTAARRRAIIDWFKELKSTLFCAKCPENHPACLEFHHNDPSQKDSSIAEAVRRCWSKQRILAEIAKCTVVCSNCHQKIHWADTFA